MHKKTPLSDDQPQQSRLSLAWCVTIVCGLLSAYPLSAGPYVWCAYRVRPPYSICGRNYPVALVTDTTIGQMRIQLGDRLWPYEPLMNLINAVPELGLVEPAVNYLAWWDRLR